MMIIDVHYHIFPRLGTPSGGEDPALNVKLWQYHVRDARRFRRKSDGTVVDKQLLEFNSDDLNDMPDIDFRLTDYGKAEFTVDGVDYYVQIYPPSLQNNEAPPERMVAEMDIAGVDIGVLQHDHVYGSLNEY
jgi:hypothetical protein